MSKFTHTTPLRIDLQISIFGFSHELLVFSIFHRQNVKSESHTPLSLVSLDNSLITLVISKKNKDCEKPTTVNIKEVVIL